ncbi:MAG: Rhodanese-like domain protein [Parcubacteria bacterium C7867-001]|nr:MAG: Rhodanese-like domain protein [Parcubacteria bacterium C7867-001]
MRIVYIVIALAALGLIGWLVLGGAKSATGTPTAENLTGTTTAPVEGTTYQIDPSASTVTFAGSKPLIPNYVDTGTIGIKSGTLSVNGATGTGSVVIDMATVKVGMTGKGTGPADSLTEHLKKSDFFDIATYPTATFTISNVAARADSGTTSLYDVTGTLTMKGKTNEVTFPAKIYLQDGKLHADASVTIDRTKWGITFGSKDFVANIGNNAISNDVKLTLNIVANPQ